MEKSMRNPRFITRVFGPLERERFAGGHRFEHAAACFAAKEAFAKALGTGVRGFALAEVQTLPDERGAPCLRLSGRAAELAAGLQFSVSLSHERGYAAAVVAAWPDEKTGGSPSC